MTPKIIWRDAEQKGNLEMAENNNKPEVATTVEVQVTPATENGVAAATAHVVEPTTSNENKAPETVTDDAGKPVDQVSTDNPNNGEVKDVDNDVFDEERFRHTLRGFRDREKEADRKLKALETQLAAIESDRAEAKQKLLTVEEQKALEQNQLRELAEQRGSALTQLEQEAAQRQRELESRINTLQTQNQALDEGMHQVVDDTIRNWPESIKAFIPGRKEVNAEVRNAAMKKAERAAEELMSRPASPGNGPLPVNNAQPAADNLRDRRRDRIYEVI